MLSKNSDRNHRLGSGLENKCKKKNKSFSKNNFGIQHGSPFNSSILNEPKRQQIFNIRPHLKCKH